MSEEVQERQAGANQPEIKFHVAPDLDYVYRDVANIYVGLGDVVLEFGNHHRSMPGNVTISDRIVLNMANAQELQQSLQQALQAAQVQLQQQFALQNK